MGSYLLGCDIGTTSTKTVLVKKTGEVFAEYQLGYEVNYPQPGWAEQDANWYWQAFTTTCQAIIQKASIHPKEIAAIGISGMAPNCILVDRDFTPLKSALIWMDTRAVEECAWLEKAIGSETAFQVNGNPIHPYYGLPKLLWERNHHASLYQQAYKVLSAKDFVFARLTGEVFSDYSTSTLNAVAFDIRSKKWDEQILREIGVAADKFPISVPCEQVVGQVAPEAARLTGLMQGTPVIAGTVDTGADAVACNTIAAGSSFLTMGTAICLGVVSDQPNFARGLMVFPHPVHSSQKYITTGVVTAGGALLKWLAGLLLSQANEALPANLFAMLDQEAEQVPPGSAGLIALPYFMGERAPIWNAEARGVLFGLSLHHRRGHVARALLESVGYALRTIIELAEKSGIHYSDTITLIGGGARSRVWNQILADTTGLKMVEAKHALGAAVGSALIAGVGAGILPDYQSIRNWIDLGEPVYPNSANQLVYQRYFHIFQNLYNYLLHSFQQLNEIRRIEQD